MNVGELHDKLSTLIDLGFEDKPILTNYHFHGEIPSIGLTPNYAVTANQADPLSPEAVITSFAIVGEDELNEEERPIL